MRSSIVRLLPKCLFWLALAFQFGVNPLKLGLQIPAAGTLLAQGLPLPSDALDSLTHRSLLLCPVADHGIVGGTGKRQGGISALSGTLPGSGGGMA